MKRAIALAVAAFAFAAGCLEATPPGGEPPTNDTGSGDPGGDEPRRADGVYLTLRLSAPSGRPDSPVTATATVTNGGDRPVRHFHATGCETDVALRVVDDQGEPAHTEAPSLRCDALHEVTLAPGANVTSTLTFDGTIFPPPEFEARDAPAGRYVFVASFTYSGPGPIGDTTIEQRAPFEWEVPRGGGNGVAAGEPEITVVVDPAAFAAGERVEINATAMNQGERPVYYNDLCGPVFTFHLFRDGRELRMSEPLAYCLALSEEPLGPGERVSRNATWDGRVWTETGGYEEAAPGGYRIVARFHAWTESGFEGRAVYEGEAAVEYEG